jgi:WD40 repeat protein
MDPFREMVAGMPALKAYLLGRLYGPFRLLKQPACAMRDERNTIKQLCPILFSENSHTIDGAKAALSTLPSHERERLCDHLLLNEDMPLQRLCNELGCLPGDPDRRALFRAVCGDIPAGPGMNDKELLVHIARGYLKASWAERLTATRRMTASGTIHLLSEVPLESCEPWVIPARTLSLMILKAAARGDYDWISNRLFSFPLPAAHTAVCTLKSAGYFPDDKDPDYWKALFASIPETFEYPSSLEPPLPAFSTGEVRFYRMSVNPAGTILATGSYHGNIELWKLPEGRNLHTIRTGAGAIISLAFSTDGVFLACGGSHGRLFIIDARAGKVIRDLSTGNESIRALCWLPERTELAAGGSEGSLVVVSTGNERVLSASNSVPGVTTLACARDGRIFSGHEDGSIRAWDHGKESEFRFYPSHKGPVRTLICGKNDQDLLSGSAGGPFMIHSADSGKLAGTAGDMTSLCTAMAAAPDGSWCAAGTISGSLRAWSLPNGREICGRFVHRNGIRALVSSTDGSMIIAGTSKGFIHVIPVREPASARIIKGTGGGIHQLYTTPQEILVSLTWQGVIEIRSLSTGRLLQRLAQAGGNVSCIGSSDSAGLLAVATSGGLIRIWDQRNLVHAGCVDAYVPSITAIALSRDGNTAVLAGNDSSMLVVRTTDGSIVRQFQGHSGSLHALSLHPDGTLCAAAGWDNRIYLYQVTGNNPPAVLPGHRSTVTHLSFLSTGDKLVSGSYDRTIRLWDLSENREIAKMTGHSGVVSTVAISPDNRLIASGSRDRTIRLWSIPDATCCSILEGHKDWVTSIAFCGGNLMASGDSGGRIAFWTVPEGELIRMEQSGAGSVSGISCMPGNQKVISAHQSGLGLVWKIPWTTVPRETTPDDLETIRSHLPVCHSQGSRTGSAWKFVEMLSIGHLRSFIVPGLEPPLGTGYEIEMAGGSV